jgi:hypothetical protein
MTLFNKRCEVQARPLNTKAIESEAAKVGGCGGCPRTDVPASGYKRNRKERMPIPEPSDQFQTDPTRTQ